jgi:endoglucanase
MRSDGLTALVLATSIYACSPPVATDAGDVSRPSESGSDVSRADAIVDTGPVELMDGASDAPSDAMLDAAPDAVLADATTDASTDATPFDAASCGNGTCDSAEDSTNCCDDCGCGAGSTSICVANRCDATHYAGVNLSGGEFGSGHIPGTYGRDYTYPTNAEFGYFRGRGMNIIRLPFLWARVQRTLSSALDATELGRLDAAVDAATSRGLVVILDPHNYARYGGQVIGASGSSVSAADFADFWRRLAMHYQTNARVWFGLMNEPHDMATELWLDDANAAIAAIRGTGATNWILVPGNAWTGAHSWSQNWYGTSNATVMQGVVDPMDHYIIEVHQYLDSDSSGTSETCVSEMIGVQRLTGFTDWLRTNHLHGFLGEVGAANNATCLAAIDRALAFMDANADVWTGWTWWSAGPWWGSYFKSLEPMSGMDAPQMDVLARHF